MSEAEQPFPPLILAVAPNGARKTRADHPAVPITPEELARTAEAAGFTARPGARELEEAEVAHEREREARRTWRRYDELARSLQRELAELSLEGEALAESEDRARDGVDEVEAEWSAWKRRVVPGAT